jgi:RNA polymerase sigma-70 factor (ECF subfamily)
MIDSTGKTAGRRVVSLKGSSVKGSNGSKVLEIKDWTAPISLMPSEPDVPSSQRCDDRRDREVGSIQEVIRLFDQTHAPLRRYLIFLGLSPEDADDCLQEAFLRLHKHFASLVDVTNVRGWLFQVAKNLARDRRKSATMHRTSTSHREYERLTSAVDPQDTPEASLLKQERLEWFRSAVARLTPQQVECLQLRVAGLRYREIAAAMGINISSVGELVQRAMTRLSEDSNEFRKG